MLTAVLVAAARIRNLQPRCGDMTNLNKLDSLSSNSVAPVNRIQKSSTGEAIDQRQDLAALGKVLPAVQQSDKHAEERRKELNNAVRNVSGYVQNITRELNFSVDEELGRTVVTVVDENTGDVIRQIPSEDMLELAKNLAEIKERTTKGLLFRGDA
jgi:flagellar protein FlaG